MIHNSLQFVFFGTDEFAVIILDELKKEGFVPAPVVTVPDRRKGRGMKLTPPPVKIWAEENHITVLQPEKLDEELVYKLKAKSYQLFVVASYGKILPKEILDIPKHGTLNVHPSLLPLFRGPSPIHSQILACPADGVCNRPGENSRMVGVTIILLDEEVDHGPIVAQEVLPMPTPLPSTKKLEEILARAGGKLLAQTIPEWTLGNIDPQEQDHKAATYTKIIKKEDGLIDILTDDPEMLYRKFKAFDPWPGIYFFQNGKRVKVTDAAFTDEQFIIKKVIPEGKSEINYQNSL